VTSSQRNSLEPAGDSKRILDDLMVDEIGRLSKNPFGYVRYAFPWGEPGTELERHKGPHDWQREVLYEIANGLDQPGEVKQPILISVASGHGIGKSALVSWLVLWCLSTFEDSRAVVTANTKPQLETKTWPELGKWHRLAINGDWFEYASTSIHAKNRKRKHTWRCDALPWTKERPESFQGLHNEGKRLMVIFDEASAIENVIWEATEGAMTDESCQILWVAFGNPTRNSGRFRECFGRLKHRWITRQVDSRSVPGTNKELFNRWIEDYGEDSDFARVRIKGQFPRTGNLQFISNELTRECMEAEPICHLEEPLVLGVDVARHGDDEIVIQSRRGRDCRTFGRWILRGMDTMQLAAKVVEVARRPREEKADMVFIDMTGIGAGVLDRVRQLGVPAIGVNFGSKADGGWISQSGAAGEAYANKASEMYGTLRSQMKEGLALPDDPELEDQLTGREYGYNAKNEIQLEKKDDMKDRGLSSPDRADALALTYAYPVENKPQLRGQQQTKGGVQIAESDWDPLEDA